MSDTYRTVTTRLRAARKTSILVDGPQGQRADCWIPRSLIHGVDDGRLDVAFLDSEITFRLMEWKAEEIGFA